MLSDRRHCSQKVQLVAGYGAAVGAYYDAVSQLEADMISGSTQMYEDRYRSAERARTVCEAARETLAEHVAQHGC